MSGIEIAFSYNFEIVETMISTLTVLRQLNIKYDIHKFQNLKIASVLSN
jgi:hypothetical protein